MILSDDEKREALSVLAYRTELLNAMIEAAVDMAREWDAQKKLVEGVRRTVVDRGGVTTSSTMVSSWGVSPATAESEDLLEYRAYVELALVLARLFHDVVARKTSGFKTDVLACDLVGDPDFTLGGLDELLLKRIRKGTALHLTNYSDPEGKEWRLADIGEWAGSAIEGLLTKLREGRPDLAEFFEAERKRFAQEM